MIQWLTDPGAFITSTFKGLRIFYRLVSHFPSLVTIYWIGMERCRLWCMKSLRLQWAGCEALSFGGFVAAKRPWSKHSWILIVVSADIVVTEK
jgi:hypothetical protein